MLLYFGLAIAASVLMALGLLMMKSHAQRLPEARGSSILSGVIAWIRDPLWVGGLGVQTLGFALYLVALAGAPVSMIAVMMQGGIALFVVFSAVFLGERAKPIEWAGIVAIVLGMILLSLSLGANAPHSAIDIPGLIELCLVLVVLGAAPFTRRRLADGGAAQAIASGIAFGMGSLFAKAMTDSFVAAWAAPVALRIVANPWVYATVAANVSGIVMLQNSFHQARAIITMPLSSALSNLVPIAGGTFAFGESLPHAPVAAAMRVSAFALTILASVMLAAAEETERLA